MNERGIPSEREPSDPERRAHFVELYSQHCTRIQYYLMALLPMSNEAADVMQETSLVLWKKFETFEIGTNFFAWACKIARLQTLKYFERNKRSFKLFDGAALERISVEAENSAGENIIRLDILESCLKDLPAEDSNIIRRRYQPGATVKQLAAEIGMSADRLSKSLAKMRRLLLACIQRKLTEDGSLG